MSQQLTSAIKNIDEIFIKKHPFDATSFMRKMDDKELLDFVSTISTTLLLPAIEALPFNNAARILELLPIEKSIQLISKLPSTMAVNILNQLPSDKKDHYLTNMPAPLREEFIRLQSYAPDTVGSIMDTRAPSFRADMSVQDIVETLRNLKSHAMRSLYVTNNENKLIGKISFEHLATAERNTLISEIIVPAQGATQDFLPRDEALGNFEKYKVVDIPVTDVNGVLLGVIYNDKLMKEMETQTISNLQTMVGVDKNERALSSPFFAVRKRLPWLQINLATAFLAASVVGLFESLIAQYTALAVLLPVVAGQSGNAGAQAQAVTMRSLTVREISINQWFSVLRKEIAVGVMNGLAIAVTTAIGVFLWSWSWGLSAVIFLSMVLAMVIAGIAGVLIPVALVKFGQDPAQSSSIVLTTVTDVAGFFAFLGIAMALSRFL